MLEVHSAVANYELIVKCAGSFFDTVPKEFRNKRDYFVGCTCLYICMARGNEESVIIYI